MAYNQKMRLPDGQELVVYSEGNTNSGVIRMDGSSLSITGAHTNVHIRNGANLLFQGGAATLGGVNTILSLGQAGDTIALDVAGVTYKLGTVTGNTTFSNDVTVSGTLTPAKLSGTIDMTGTTLSWARDTDYASISYVDYGADNDQLTIDIGDRNTDFVRFRGANATGVLENVLDVAANGVTSYKTFNAPTIQENGTNLSSKYLGISAKAADSDKLDNLDSTQFLRSDADDTLDGNLTINGTLNMGSNRMFGKTFSVTGNTAIDETNGSPWYGIGRSTVLVNGNTGGATTVQVGGYFGINLKTQSGEVIIGSASGTFTYNGNTIWHAGNDGSGSGLDADKLDGIESAGFYQVSTAQATLDVNNLSLGTKLYVGSSGTWTNKGPSGHNGSALLSMNTHSGQYYNQLWFDTNGKNFYHRAIDAGVIGAWQKVWTDANDGAGSGLDADLLDGLNSSAFMRTDASTSTTGSITIGTGTTSVLTNQADGSLRHSNSYGYIDIGPKNVSYAHIYTDRPSFYFNQELYVSGNKVWNAGNDGATSGLDADMVDGVHLSGLVQTARNVSTSTGLTGGGNLSADRTLSFDTTWGDARYLVVGGTAANSELLDNLNSTQFLRSDVDTTLSANLTLSSGEKSVTFASGSKIRSNATGSLIISSGNGTDKAIYLRANGDTSTVSQVEIGASYFQWNGNTVWTAGNDGAGSGLDADTVDGVQLTGLVQTGRTLTGGTGILIGGVSTAQDLSANRTITFDTTWGDARYLGLTAKAADSDKLDNLNSTQFVRSDADDTIAANLNINSNTNSRYLIISRSGSSTEEMVRHGVDDGNYHVYYVNDETAAGMQWTIENNDTEGGTGTNANTSVLRFQGQATPTLTLNNNKIWHEGNDGAGSGLDADTVDGVQLADLVQTSRTLTGGTGILIDSVSTAQNLTANRTITFDTTWGDNRYLGKTAKATDSDKLDNLDSAQFLRSDVDDTMTGRLTLEVATGGDGSWDDGGILIKNTGATSGEAAIAFNNTSTGSNYWIHGVNQSADFDIAYGTAYTDANTKLTIDTDGQIWSGTKTHKYWHAGNDGASSGLDADLLDGIHASGFGQNFNLGTSADLNTYGQSGFYRLGNTPVNAPTSASYGQMIVAHGSGDTTLQILGPYNSDNLYFRSGNPTDVGGSGTYRSWSKIWNDNNDGSGSGLDADKLDGLEGSSYLRSNANDTFTGNLTLTGNQTISGTLDVAGALSLSGVPMAGHREGGTINYLGKVAGRIVNKNPDFITGDYTGYARYDNNSSNRLVLSIITNDVAPNATGKVLHLDYNPARNSGVVPNPGWGGFTMDIARDTADLNSWGYRMGNRYLFRVIAWIPTGRSLQFASNDVGTGTSDDGSFKWLTSTAGANDWREYVGVLTIQETQTDTGVSGTSDLYSSTGYFYINGGTDTAFTWDVSICQVIGIDEVPDVDRAPTLNVGYKTGKDLGWGELYATGNIYTDGKIYAGDDYGLYSSTGASWFNPLNSSNNMHIEAGEGNKAIYIDAETFNFRNTSSTNRFTIDSSGNSTAHGGLTVNNGLTVGQGLTLNKVGNIATISFPNVAGTGNDPAYIKHIETTANVGIMQFSASDDKSDTDYFSFGSTPSGTYSEGARITTSGNATFAGVTGTGLTVNGNATVTGNLNVNSWINLQIGVSDGIAIGSAKIQGVADGEIVVLADEFRLGRAGAAWDYSKWAGFKYSDTLSTLTIGGPASSNIKDSTTPVPRIDINFEGTTTANFDGKVIVKDNVGGTIGLSDLTKGWLQIGTATSGMGLDTNEIVVAGNTFHLGTIGDNSIQLTPGGTTTLTASMSGVSVTGTLSASGRVTATGGLSVPSGQNIYVGGWNTGSYFRMHQTGTESYLDYATGALNIRAGSAVKMTINATGNLGLGVAPHASHLLYVNGSALFADDVNIAGANEIKFVDYGGGWFMQDTSWIRASGGKSLYMAGGVIRTDGVLQVGNPADLYVVAETDSTTTPASFNWKNTIFSNTSGKVSINNTTNNEHPLHVKSNGSYMGINLQATADTDVSGISFQRSNGYYNWHIASSGVAASDLVFYGGNIATMSSLVENARLTNTGNFETRQNITVGKRLKVHGDSARTDAPSIDLALGDSDTGFDWVSDGNFNVMANSADVMNIAQTEIISKVHHRMQNHLSFDASSGRGVRFWNSDSYKIWMSSTSDGTWGGGGMTGAASSDYNFYYRITGATRGHIFQQGSTTLAQIDGNGKVHSKDGFRHGNFGMEHNSSEDSLDFVYYG